LSADSEVKSEQQKDGEDKTEAATLKTVVKQEQRDHVEPVTGDVISVKPTTTDGEVTSTESLVVVPPPFVLTKTELATPVDGKGEKQLVEEGAPGEVKGQTTQMVEGTQLPHRDEKFEFLDDVADFHLSAVRRIEEHKDVVFNIGPNRRALCARRDLAIRRALCKVEKASVWNTRQSVVFNV